MRVLPVGTMTAPRFPLLKSYCRFILVSLLSGRATSRNESHVAASIAVHDHQNPPKGIQPYGEEAPLASNGLIFGGDRLRVEARTLRVSKTYPVLQQICSGLTRI